jgi:uncharacterized membrane protein YsdA (DUF1294 family)
LGENAFAVSYWVIISIIAVIVTAKDKICAIKDKRRTPEAILLLLSALGGSVMMLIMMLLIRHKTKHKKFMIGIPLIIILQVIAIYYLCAIF